MPAIYPTPAHSDLADGREGEHARSTHPRERTRDPLIDHPRPAPPSCCHLPLLPHHCCPIQNEKPLDPKGGAGATPCHTALRRGGGGRRPRGPPEGPPQPPGPQGRRRRHLSSPCATARRERPEAYPKGRPYRQKSDQARPRRRASPSPRPSPAGNSSRRRRSLALACSASLRNRHSSVVGASGRVHEGFWPRATVACGIRSVLRRAWSRPQRGGGAGSKERPDKFLHGRRTN